MIKTCLQRNAPMLELSAHKVPQSPHLRLAYDAVLTVTCNALKFGQGRFQKLWCKPMTPTYPPMRTLTQREARSLAVMTQCTTELHGVEALSAFINLSRWLTDPLDTPDFDFPLRFRSP